MSNFFRRAPGPLLVLVLLCFLSVGPASASASSDLTGGPVDSEDQTLTTTAETEGGNITVNVTLPPAAVSAPEASAENVSDVLVPDTGSDSYTTYDLDPPAQSEAEGSTVRDILVSLFGPYTPRTHTVTDHLADGSSVTSTQAVPGLAGLDYEWLAGVALFSLILFCLFRILGGVLKNG